MSLKFTLHRLARVTWHLFLCLLGLMPIAGLPVVGQDTVDSTLEVQVGLGGHVKLGKWIPIFIDTDSSATRFEVEALDGDDTPVVYSGPLLTDSEHPGKCQAWARVGRIYGDLRLRLFDDQGQNVDELDLPLHGGDRLAEFRASTRSLVLTLESGDRFRKIVDSVSSVGAGERTRLVVSRGSEDPLPLNWLGYDGVESVLLVTSDIQRIENLTTKQIDALEAWIKRGGKLILSVASNSQTLLAPGGPLARFCPGTFTGLGECKNSKRLETFCDSREQLIALRGQPLPISELTEIDGRVVVDDGKSKPLIIKQAVGLGQVVFATFDLDSERVIKWKGLSNLIGRLVSNAQRQEVEQNVQQSTRGSSVSHFGYQDLIGQLRVPLDKFSDVQFVKFALIAALIGIYILCIGPGDFFFLRKFVGKMELTWITFPLLALLFCGLAFGISKITRPDSIQLNQLEIIDVDAIDNRVRGTVWTNLYSPSGENCSLGIESRHELGFEIDASLVTWHGLPGDGLGGMLTTADPGLLKTSYRQEFDLAENGNDVSTQVVDLPLQVSSTKPTFTQWWSDNPKRIRSRLKYNPRLQQITGTVTNPFEFTLNNCRLVFENWAYKLDQPLDSGQTFDIQSETNEKTLKSLLTRKVRKSKEDRSDNSPWDPIDTRVNRIADIMMFYEAAGGVNYTGLTHDYQSFVDMTDYLDLKRAILVGEVASSGAILKINDQAVADQYDQVTTIIRIVLPVEYPKDAKSNNSR